VPLGGLVALALIATAPARRSRLASAGEVRILAKRTSNWRRCRRRANRV